MLPEPITLYQTVENKNTPDYIEQNGPFKSQVWRNPWLGMGYYFWDTHIELAHWWGNLPKNYNGNYIICEADGEMNGTCWDLHGIGAHRKQFIEACDALIKDKGKHILVPQVIEFFKSKGKFIYKAIRAMGHGGMIRLQDNEIISAIKFNKSSEITFILYPPIQVCLITKNALNLQNYRIVYPDDLSEELI